MIDIGNTVSGPVVVGILTIIGGIGKIIVDVYKIKHKADDLQSSADDAKEASQKAVENTKAVSNGFARDVGSKLDRILAQQSSMEASLRDHLQWHVEQSGKGG